MTDEKKAKVALQLTTDTVGPKVCGGQTRRSGLAMDHVTAINVRAAIINATPDNRPPIRLISLPPRPAPAMR